MRESLWVGIVAAIAVLATAALNLRGLGGAFLSDDFAHLYAISHVDREHQLARWTLARFVEPLASGNFAYRPIAFLTYAIEWRAFGTWAAGWRMTSLALHFANTALVYCIVSRWTLGTIRLDRSAMLAAAMFAAFPFAGEVTFWPAGRADVLAAFFGLLFLATFDGGPHAAGGYRQAARVTLLLAALLSKESALPLALAAPVIDFALRATREEPPSGPQLRSALRFVARDLAPSWLACAAYVAWRSVLFGTPLKVYSYSALPANPVEYLQRLASYNGMLARQPGIDPPWLWAGVAALLMAVLFGAGAGARAAHRRARPLSYACALCALGYILAPALLSAANFRVGDGARNFYVAWIYVAFAAGFAAPATRLGAIAGIAAIGWMLVAQEGSLRQWQAAAREMRAVLKAIPSFAERLAGDQYALLLLPDHVGVALFARNAEGAIVDWPIQRKDYLDVVAGTTEFELAGWPQHFADGSIARLKGAKDFDMIRFAGVFCWSASSAAFTPVAPAGPVPDPGAWTRNLLATVARSDCMPGTLNEVE